MSEEIEYVIHGDLINDNVRITDEKAIDDLTRKGYGEKEDKKKYFLKMYESLYLLFGNKLALKSKQKNVTFDELVGVAMKRDEEAWTRFLIYRDLRSRGYVAKEGFGFNVDFRVYERGEFGNKPAKYVVFGINEGKEMEVDKLNEAIEQITRMGKEPVIAVIERRGEVIYYKVSKTRFMNNKTTFDMSAITKE